MRAGAKGAAGLVPAAAVGAILQAGLRRLLHGQLRRPRARALRGGAAQRGPAPRSVRRGDLGEMLFLSPADSLWVRGVSLERKESPPRRRSSRRRSRCSSSTGPASSCRSSRPASSARSSRRCASCTVATSCSGSLAGQPAATGEGSSPPLLPAGLRFYFIDGGLIGLSRQLPLLADLRFVLAIEGVPKELLGDVQLLQSWLCMLAQMHGVDTQAIARTSP